MTNYPKKKELFKNEVRQLDERRDKADGTIKRLTEMSQELLSEKDKLRTENATLHAKIEELRKEIDELRTAPILNISPTPIEDALDHEKQ
jgi:uncharacterized coiled-coil DUF342 family protein